MAGPMLHPGARERRARSVAWLLILSVLICGSIPYLLGYGSTPPGTVFIGYPYPLDTNRYFNEMLQGARHGALFCRNHLTLEDHPPAFIFHFYMALGRLAALAGLEMISMFHLARCFFGAVLLFYCYARSRYFFRQVRERLLFLALLGFSGGFHSIAESCVFQSVSLFPHFAASMLFMVVYYFNLVVLNVRRRGRRGAPLAVCVAMLLLTGLTHPWNLVPMGMVSAGILAFLIWRRRRWVDPLSNGALVATALAVLAVHGWTQSVNPVFGAMARNNVMRFDHPVEIVNAFGLLGAGALAGVVLVAVRRWRSPLVFPCLWFVLTLAAILAPTPFQRRLLEGLHISVALLTAWVVMAAARRLARRFAWSERRSVLAGGLIALAATIPGNVVFVYYPNMRELHYIHYPDARMIALAQWMDANLPEDADVMASVATAQFLVRYALLDVYVAHSVATLDFEVKRDHMHAFYGGQMSDSQMRQFVEENGIQYVVAGPYERFGAPFRPGERSWLTPLWAAGPFAVFQVTLSPGPTS